MCRVGSAGVHGRQLGEERSGPPPGTVAPSRPDRGRRHEMGERLAAVQASMELPRGNVAVSEAAVGTNQEATLVEMKRRVRTTD
jgi:hypothetical protein